MTDFALQVEGLSVEIRTGDGTFSPVQALTFEVAPGECHGLVGESGCGKSLTLRAVIGLLPTGARISGGSVSGRFDGDRVVPFDERFRGTGIAMVFQEPMVALNPTKRVGDLIAEGPLAHRLLSKRDARARALEVMHEVGIPDPERRARAWPWELSGGLRQRVMIAMALACEPRVLLCDEPTTALDVSVQDQILRLLDRLRRERGLAIVFVTHDLAVIGQLAQRVSVMYAGQIVETGSVDDVFRSPRHPYTAALLRSAPLVDQVPEERLAVIHGSPPDPRSFPLGCRFAPRCDLAEPACSVSAVELRAVGTMRLAACLRSELVAEVAR